jgi:hypothetical protein
MTWKLTKLFFQLRRKLSKWYKPEPLTGEIMFSAKIYPVDYEGKSPTAMEIYFDDSLDFQQLQMIAEELGGSFLALKRMKERKEQLAKEAGELARKDLTKS